MQILSRTMVFIPYGPPSRAHKVRGVPIQAPGSPEREGKGKAPGRSEEVLVAVLEESRKVDYKTQ
jgi:hypothetical protein